MDWVYGNSLYLLVSSADSLKNSLDTDLKPDKMPARSGSILFETL